MTEKRKSPSKRDTPWFTVLVRWDNLAKLKEIAARNKAPLTQTVGRLINNEYDAVFPERRKEPDACTHNVRTT
jgi:hypothetical protein